MPAYTGTLTPVNLSAQSANGNQVITGLDTSEGEGVPSINSFLYQVNITAISGASATLTVSLDDSIDGTNYNAVTGGATAGLTATGRTVVRVTAPMTNLLRLSWTITGTTPSVTFTITCVGRGN